MKAQISDRDVWGPAQEKSLHPASSRPASPAKEPSVFCAALIACEGTGGRGAPVDLGCQISSLNLGMGPCQIISPSFLKGFLHWTGPKLASVCHFRITYPPVNQHTVAMENCPFPSMICLFKLMIFHSKLLVYQLIFRVKLPFITDFHGFPGLTCLSFVEEKVPDLFGGTSSGVQMILDDPD